jgi:uncharacterized membrane protein
MIHGFVDAIVRLLHSTNMSEWLIVLLISFMPIAESRLGIPIGMRLGLSPEQSWLFAFVGSSLATPIVLILLVPLINKLARSKGISAIAKVFAEVFEKNADKLTKAQCQQKQQRQSIVTLRKMLAVCIFVALPGPMTGVWGGAAVASIIKLTYVKALFSVIAGNLIASLLVLAFADFFIIFIDYIIFALIALAVLSVLWLIFKLARKALFTKRRIRPKL